MINKELALTMAFEIGVIAITAIASFLIPGLGGLIVSGALQFLGDIGIELFGGGFPKDPVWFLTEFIAVFGPFFSEFKAAKLESKILLTAEKGIAKAEKVLQKVDDALIEGIEFLKKKASKFFNKSSGLTEDLENEVRQIEKQEIAREKFGKDAKVKKKIISFTPNTKNPDSWIAGIGFVEKARFGPRDIRGDLIITYYVNNHKRIGYILKPMEKIVLGRTSSGERVKGGKNNKDRYKKYHIAKDMTAVKTKKVVFKNAKYFSDYLGFCKAGSWGGYYMRRWMVGLPGRKGKTNSLILFGSIWRVYSKLKTLTGDAKTLALEPNEYFKGKALQYWGQTQLGSKYNKYYGVFSQAVQWKNDPVGSGRSLFRSKMEQKRDLLRENMIHKKRK